MRDTDGGDRPTAEERTGGPAGAQGGRTGSPAGAGIDETAQAAVASDGPGAEGAGADATGFADSEVDILRSELNRLGPRVEALEAELAEAKDRYLRSRAELDTARRRMAVELELAREGGLQGAVLPVLSVFDDLARALEAAAKSGDAAAILPGVRGVQEALLRNLEGLGIHPLGAVGEPFDPEQHEALAAIPGTDGAAPGTICQVYQLGFSRGGKVIRPARVAVVQEAGSG